MAELEFGQKVYITHRLRRRSKTLDGRKFWVPVTDFGQLEDIDPCEREGIIIGKRTLADGKRVWEDYNYTFLPERHFLAYVVAWNMHRNPAYVLPQHILLSDGTPFHAVSDVLLGEPNESC